MKRLNPFRYTALVLLLFGYLASTTLSSCRDQKKKDATEQPAEAGDEHPAGGEHPSSDEHPESETDSTAGEHPSGGEHPTGDSTSTEHPGN